MPKEEAPLQQLQHFVPPGSFDDVVLYLQRYKIHLTVTQKRQSILGDYRHAHGAHTHRISVNGNLNPYAFLITLLHELAHLFTFEKYGNKVLPHGKEWQHEFGMILTQFISKKIFPPDVEEALRQSLHSPAASSCGDEQLLRVLHRYDTKKEGMHLVEQLPEGALFKIKGNRVFKKGMQVRKRYKCTEVKTGKLYLFSAVYEVELLSA
jgi:SprT protein